MTMPAMPNVPQEEVARVRGYLTSQAAKLSLPELVEKLRKDSAPLKDVAASVPAERFRARPGPDDWSAAEVLTHVLEMTESGARDRGDHRVGGAAAADRRPAQARRTRRPGERRRLLAGVPGASRAAL